MYDEQERMQCPRCQRFHSDDAHIEAILCWGYCASCDALDLIPLEQQAA